jgi:hypothetical protein
MKWFRTTHRLNRWLVPMFVVAQFAGAVPSPLASAQAFADAVASHVHHQHVHHQGRAGSTDRHRDQDGDHADHCCALHAFFAGVLPAVIAVETVDVVGQRLRTDLADIIISVAPNRLDRPPRPLL